MRLATSNVFFLRVSHKFYMFFVKFYTNRSCDGSPPRTWMKPWTVRSAESSNTYSSATFKFGRFCAFFLWREFRTNIIGLQLAQTRYNFASASNSQQVGTWTRDVVVEDGRLISRKCLAVRGIPYESAILLLCCSGFQWRRSPKTMTPSVRNQAESLLEHFYDSFCFGRFLLDKLSETRYAQNFNVNFKQSLEPETDWKPFPSHSIWNHF